MKKNLKRVENPSNSCNKLKEICKYAHKNNELTSDVGGLNFNQIKDFFDCAYKADSNYKWCGFLGWAIAIIVINCYCLYFSFVLAVGVIASVIVYFFVIKPKKI
jgi:hypothetical protein